MVLVESRRCRRHRDHGRVMTVLIPRNTDDPDPQWRIFTTAADSQPSVGRERAAGERKIAGDNRTLAKFGLQGIAPAPRGTPQIEGRVRHHANGIVTCRRRQGHRKQQHVKVTSMRGSVRRPTSAAVEYARKNEAEDDNASVRRRSAPARDARILDREHLGDAGDLRAAIRRRSRVPRCCSRCALERRRERDQQRGTATRAGRARDVAGDVLAPSGANQSSGGRIARRNPTM